MSGKEITQAKLYNEIHENSCFQKEGEFITAFCRSKNEGSPALQMADQVPF